MHKIGSDSSHSRPVVRGFLFTQYNLPGGVKPANMVLMRLLPWFHRVFIVSSHKGIREKDDVSKFINTPSIAHALTSS